jgi:hypothetical protein
MRVTISAGTTVEIVKSLRDRYSGRFPWVRTNGETWLIDDPDLLDRATSFFAEELALEPEQRAIAGEEAELDREEERLEDRHDAASEARLDEIRRKQRDVSRREAELDQREDALERVAEEKLWSLVDDAIRRGVARTASATEMGRKDSYVFRDGDITWMLGKGMSADALRDIQVVHGEEFLWARRSGQTFIVSDETILDRVRSIIARKIERSEQERMLAAVVDDAIRKGVARRAR